MNKMASAYVRRVWLWQSLIVLVVGIMLAGAACAATSLDKLKQEMDQAKAQGLIGEQADGYLGIVHPPGSPEIQKLVAQINLARRQLYRGKAASADPPVTLQQYETQIMGPIVLKSAKPGEYVRGTDGRWTKVK